MMKSKRDYERRRRERRQKEEKIYQTRAELAHVPKPFQDVTEFECCLEELVFAMEDNQHQFSLGLSTVLRCLAIAEHEGYVPKLPYDWWYSLRTL